MNKLQSALRSEHDAGRRDRIANAYEEMMSDYARPSKRVVMVSTPKETVIDADFADFCKRVDATDCTSQWADRGSDHD